MTDSFVPIMEYPEYSGINQSVQMERIGGDGEEVHGMTLRQPQVPQVNMAMHGMVHPPPMTHNVQTVYDYDVYGQHMGNVQYDNSNNPYVFNGNRRIEGEEFADPSLNSMVTGPPLQPQPLLPVAVSQPSILSQPGIPRSETIGANVLSETVDVDFNLFQSHLDLDPRSIEGQEQWQGGMAPPVAIPTENSSVSSVPLAHPIEERREIIGSDTLALGSDDPRSIEGQEESQVVVINPGANVEDNNGAGAAGHISSNHQRSETIGSDTVVDDVKGGGHKADSGKNKGHPVLSDSETAESTGRGDHGRRKKERDRGDSDEADRQRRRGGGREDRKRERNRYPSFDDEDSFDEDDRASRYRDRDPNRRERDRYNSRGDRERVRDRPDRDRDRDRHDRDHYRERDRERDRDRDRDWMNRSSRYRYDDFDDTMSRPRSRNSTYHGDRDDFYGGRRRYDDEQRRREDYYRQQQRPPYYTDSLYEQRSFAMPAPRMSNAMDLPTHLDNFRRTNPAGYREWYGLWQAHQRNPTLIPFPPVPGFAGPMAGLNASFANQSQTQSVAGFVGERGSGHHSGRSSVNEGHFRTTQYDQMVRETGVLSLDDSAQFRPIQEAAVSEVVKRLTPQKYDTLHSIGLITPHGQVLRVRNGSTVVDFEEVRHLMRHLPKFKEFERFPGPLIKGTTHKNTIIQFCKRKIKEVKRREEQEDKENFILLWEYLILLLQQNGMVVGSDLAELLLKKKLRNEADITDERRDSDRELDSPLGTESKRKEISGSVEEFSEFLMYGHKKEALDYAINNDLWGHALFLASKLDERTYGHVLAKFANSIPLNHPLQTLYQMISGKQPSSVNTCCDESFGEWKPHLAMLLSNAGNRPELEQKSFVCLGDTLASRHRIFAAQFCYLMGNAEFSSDSKLGPLLGYTESTRNVIEATQMTEIYEFCRSLADSNFTLGASFLRTKLEYVRELINIGFAQEAFGYCEILAKNLPLIHPHHEVEEMRYILINYSERLKGCSEVNDLSWIEDLRGANVNSDNTDCAPTTTIPPSAYTSEPAQNVAPINTHFSTAPTPLSSTFQSFQPIHTSSPQQTGSTWQTQAPDIPPVVNHGATNGPNAHSLPDMSAPVDNNWNQGSVPSFTPLYSQPDPFPHFDLGRPAMTMPVPSDSYYPDSTNTGLHDFSNGPQERRGSGPESGSTLIRKPGPAQNQLPMNQDKGERAKSNTKIDGSGDKDSKSWFKWKLPFLSKNQAHLPDDTNPDIVWDEKEKRWINTKGQDEDDGMPKGPPPKDSDLGGAPPAPMSFQNPSSVPFPGNAGQQLPAPNFGSSVPLNQPNPGVTANGSGSLPMPMPNPGFGNKYQMARGRSLRSNYVDVLNPGATKENVPGNPMQNGRLPSDPMKLPNMFIPPPNQDINESGPVSFLTTSSATTPEETGTQPPAMLDTSKYMQNNNNYAYPATN